MKWWEQEDDDGPNCTITAYFSELVKYKNAIGNFDILPDHATMALVRAEHDKYRKGDEASITAFQEIEQLDNVAFDWEDGVLRK